MLFADDLFAGKVALVVGGTSGIGAAVANLLAGLGAATIAAGLINDDHEAAPGVTVRALDVADPDQVAALLDAMPVLDILVNGAGIIRRVDEHRLDVFERVLAINLTGTMRVCTLARPKLAIQGGCIVNMASMLSFFGGGLVPAYSASKGGVMQLTKSLAIAYAADGVRVNAVAPGWITTPLTHALTSDPDRSAPILQRTPLGRWGTPEDVAKVVAFLCSSGADFMTGVILPVDGGYLVT